MKSIVALAISSILFLMAAVQLNDDDGVFWMIVYSVAALVPLCETFLKQNWSRVRTLVFVSALGLALYATANSVTHSNLSADALTQSVNNPMSAATPYVEGNRELGGSLIAMLVILTFRCIGTLKS